MVCLGFEPGRRRRNHGAMAATYFMLAIFYVIEQNFIVVNSKC